MKGANAYAAAHDVLADLMLAGRALKHLPPERLDRAVTWWPSIVRDASEAYGYHAAVAPRLRATLDEINALDRVLDAAWVLDGSERRLVLARAMGFSWRRIMRQRRRRGDGLRHESLKRLFRDCVLRMAVEYGQAD